MSVRIIMAFRFPVATTLAIANGMNVGYRQCSKHGNGHMRAVRRKSPPDSPQAWVHPGGVSAPGRNGRELSKRVGEWTERTVPAKNEGDVPSTQCSIGATAAWNLDCQCLRKGNRGTPQILDGAGQKFNGCRCPIENSY